MRFLTPLLTLSCLVVPGTRGGGGWCSGVDRWEVGCNTCYCRAGVPYCYQGTCRPLSAASESKGVSGGSEGRCESGSTWRRQCNLCLCDNGVPVCSYIPCHAASSPPGGADVGEERGLGWRAQPPPVPAAFWTPVLVFQVGGRENCVAAAGKRSDPCTRCLCRHGVPVCSITTSCPPSTTSHNHPPPPTTISQNHSPPPTTTSQNHPPLPSTTSQNHPPLPSTTTAAAELSTETLSRSTLTERSASIGRRLATGAASPSTATSHSSPQPLATRDSVPDSP